MVYHFPPDVEKLVREQMAIRGYASEDELLRDALEVLGQFACTRDEAEEEFRQTVAAVKEGVADAEAGRVRDLRDVLNDVLSERSPETKTT